MKDKEILYTADCARLWKVHPSTAKKWLLDMEKRYGVSVVGRGGNKGNKLFTTKAALIKYMPVIVDTTNSVLTNQEITERLIILEDKVRELSKKDNLR